MTTTVHQTIPVWVTVSQGEGHKRQGQGHVSLEKRDCRYTTFAFSLSISRRMSAQSL